MATARITSIARVFLPVALLGLAACAPAARRPDAPPTLRIEPLPAAVIVPLVDAAAPNAEAPPAAEAAPATADGPPAADGAAVPSGLWKV